MLKLRQSLISIIRAQLQHQIDASRPSADAGVDIYGEVVDYVIECIERQQNLRAVEW